MVWTSIHRQPNQSATFTINESDEKSDSDNSRGSNVHNDEISEQPNDNKHDTQDSDLKIVLTSKALNIQTLVREASMKAATRTRQPAVTTSTA